MPDGFFDERREWSRWKHESLRRYLPRFADILGSQYRYIYYIDGFAGAGAYDAGQVPGSPLLGASIAEAVAKTQKFGFEIRCINVERLHPNFVKLCVALATYPKSRVCNLEGEFSDHLDGILAVTKASPALFFLDPFGYKGIEWDLMTRLTGRAFGCPTELIINFNADELDQAAGWHDSFDQPKRDAFVRNVTAIFGTAEWLRIYESPLPKSYRLERLTQLYMTRLANAIRGTVAPYAIRTIEGKVKYYLLFATRHPRGVRELSDVICDVEASYDTE